MNREDVLEFGAQLGLQAAERVAEYAGEVCEFERRRIALSSEPRLNQLRAEGYELTIQKAALERRIELAPQPNAQKSQKLRILYYWCAGIVLMIAAFFFSFLSLEPYRLGWKGALCCLGIGFVTPFAVEVFLETWRNEKFLKAIATVVFLAALVGGSFLAAVRGELLSREVKQPAPAVVIDGETAPPVDQHETFYESTGNSLRFLMICLALAVDLGAGVAIHRALLLGAALGEDAEKLGGELLAVNGRIEHVIFEITSLTNAPATFESRFWRDFYQAMITQTMRKALTKFAAFVLALVFLGVHPARADQQRLNLVVAIDLSASVATKGSDGKSNFEKNLSAAGALLAVVPPGAQITVIGITANSFADPLILLKAKTDDDPGYFGERIRAARHALVLALQKRAKLLHPDAKQTDILGQSWSRHSSSLKAPTDVSN